MIKKILRYSLLIGFVALLIYTFYYLYQKNQEPDVVYETTHAQYRDIVKKTVATGSVVPRQEIEIKPQVSGIIEKLFVEEGDKIKSGDLIAKIKVIPNMMAAPVIDFKTLFMVLFSSLYPENKKYLNPLQLQSMNCFSTLLFLF